MKKKGITLSQAVFAAIVGVSDRRLRQIEQEEDPPPRDSDGSYPAEAAGEWLRRRHMREAGVADDGKAYDYNAERARLTKAQADKTELEVAELRGEVVRMPLVEAHWQNMVAAMRAKLLALPSKAAALVASPEKLQATTDILQSGVYEALAEIAGDGIPDEVRSRVAAQERSADEGDRQAAPEVDAQPVGGRKVDAQPGRQRGTRKIPAK